MTVYSYKTERILQELRKVVPFLNLIPDQLYFELDPSEFHLPTGVVALLRKELEEKLGQYVMTYDRLVFCEDIPIEKHLCANLQGAILTGEQRQILDEYEQKVRKNNVSFVVYQKPLLFRTHPTLLDWKSL